MTDLDLDIQLEPDGFADQPQQGSPFDDFIVLLSQNVMRQIKEHTEPHLSREMGGLLIGEIWESNGVTYVSIKESIPSQVEGTYATLSFTAETWFELEQQREALFPQYKKVGWYHSHLGYGVFLSPLDIFLHECAFSLPWHVALVYDPVLSEYGVFRWRQGELVPAPFYLTCERNTFQESRMSNLIGHQLQVLSSYLDGLPGKESIVAASQHIQTRLRQISAEQLIPISPVEDALNTVLEISGMDAEALKQARSIVQGLIGQQLLLGQNTRLASPITFENDKLVLARNRVYFIKEKALYWSSLDKGAQPSLIVVPTPLRDIAANKDSLFALDEFGMIYVVPLADTEKSAASGKSWKKKADGSTYLELKTIVLSPKQKEPLQTITARDNTLYLSSKSEVWILPLLGDLSSLWPEVFSLATLTGEYPVEVRDLVVDAQENMYLADLANSRVIQMQPDGRIRFVFVGDGRRSLVSPVSLCVNKNELYILDTSIHHIIVYNLDNKTYSRHYTWGEFVGKKAIQQLYVDDTSCVYFSAGNTVHRLYRLES